MKHKSDIPEDIIDFCIDNKMTIKDGLTAMIEEKFAKVDSDLKVLKRDIMMGLFDSETKLEKITDKDMDDIDSFLKYLNDKNQPNTEEDA